METYQGMCCASQVGFGIGGTPHPNVTLIADLRGLVNHRLKPWESQVRGKALKFLTSTRMVSFQEHTNPESLNPVLKFSSWEDSTVEYFVFRVTFLYFPPMTICI